MALLIAPQWQRWELQQRHTWPTKHKISVPWKKNFDETGKFKFKLRVLLQPLNEAIKILYHAAFSKLFCNNFEAVKINVTSRNKWQGYRAQEKTSKRSVMIRTAVLYSIDMWVKLDWRRTRKLNLSRAVGPGRN